MLSGTIDYARGNILAGWAQGSSQGDIRFRVTIDGEQIAFSGLGVSEDRARTKFSTSLPRNIDVRELVYKTVVVEALQGEETFTLPLWKPIHVAATLEELEPALLERTMSCLSPAALDQLRTVIARMDSEPKPDPVEAEVPTGKTDDTMSTSVLSEIMRWA